MSSTSAGMTRDVDSTTPRELDSANLSHGDWNGYQFHTLWLANALGEHWTVQTPDGVDCYAHILPANDMELVGKAAARLATLSHPNLCVYKLGPICGGRLLITTRSAPRTIWDLFQQYWRRGCTGIPRFELLDYWRIVAETLDGTAKEHQLFHLWLHPQLLALIDNRIQIIGHGLPDLFLRPTHASLTKLNRRYAAPEIEKRRPVSRCDQYSLAVMYTELASGVHPFRGQQDRQVKCADLLLLPNAERDVVQRALETDPRKRFPTCLDFVRALSSAQPSDDSTIQTAAFVVSETPIRTCDMSSSDELMDHFVSELVLLAFGPNQTEIHKSIRCTVHSDHIEHRCVARLFPGAASLKLDGFRQQWKARPILDEPNRMVLQINLALPLWKRLLGRRARLRIDIEFLPPNQNQLRHDVSVELWPIGCSTRDAKKVLRKFGLDVLESLRMFLQAQPDQRAEERLPCIHPLRVCPVDGGLTMRDPIECMTKDISASGIGFFLPQNCDASSVFLNLPNVAEIAAFAGLAHIIRMTPCRDGWYEVGASFDMTESKHKE